MPDLSLGSVCPRRAGYPVFRCGRREQMPRGHHRPDTQAFPSGSCLRANQPAVQLCFLRKPSTRAAQSLAAFFSNSG